MGFVRVFSDYLKKVKTDVPGINLLKMVDDFTDLNNHINDLSSHQNSLMLGVVPVLGNNGADNVDTFSNKLYCQVVIGNKIDVSSLDQEVFIDTFDATGELALALQKIILNDAAQGECSFLSLIDTNSFQITTFRRSQFIGWNVIFTFNKEI